MNAVRCYQGLSRIQNLKRDRLYKVMPSDHHLTCVIPCISLKIDIASTQNVERVQVVDAILQYINADNDSTVIA